MPPVIPWLLSLEEQEALRVQVQAEGPQILERLFSDDEIREAARKNTEPTTGPESENSFLVPKTQAVKATESVHTRNRIVITARGSGLFGPSVQPGGKKCMFTPQPPPSTDVC